MVAKSCNGLVINVDSMQVYRELRILTARPTESEEETVGHELYGHVSVREPYSVANWLNDVGCALQKCQDGKQIPVLVGGTGLYFKALLEGLSQIPEIDSDIRKRIRNLTETGQSIHAMLAEKDPEMASRLKPSDTQRIMRALEVLESTGRSLSSWQEENSEPMVDGSKFEKIVLMSSREWLKDRIDRRVDEMVKNGALYEAAALMDLELPLNSPAMRAIGVRSLILAAGGEIELEEAVERCKIETRQYAKRQDTWFRNQFPDWRRIDPEDMTVELVAMELAQKIQNL